jgi:hypothetical protein
MSQATEPGSVPSAPTLAAHPPPPSQAVVAPPLPSQPRSTYGRNLRGGYASHWQAAQRQKEAARIQLRLTEEAVRNAQNTITVAIWKEVRCTCFFYQLEC